MAYLTKIQNKQVKVIRISTKRCIVDSAQVHVCVYTQTRTCLMARQVFLDNSARPIPECHNHSRFYYMQQEMMEMVIVTRGTAKNETSLHLAPLRWPMPAYHAVSCCCPTNSVNALKAELTARNKNKTCKCKLITCSYHPVTFHSHYLAKLLFPTQINLSAAFDNVTSVIITIIKFLQHHMIKTSGVLVARQTSVRWMFD